MKYWFGFPLIFGVFPGCQNPCQDLCRDMADYLSDECGIEVSQADIDACIDSQAEAEPDEKRTCAAYDRPKDIEQNFGCDELANYFNEDPE